MSEQASYSVTFSSAARRGMNKLPLSAAAALYEHLIGPVSGNPYRLGKPLERPYDGVYSTRRGEYRALYVINDHEHSITVTAAAHRRDAYQTH